MPPTRVFRFSPSNILDVVAAPQPSTMTPNEVPFTVSPEDMGTSESGGSTIPFLRRLRDMLQENEGVISFVPGHRKNGQVVLGKLVVHDRIEVEATVLPRYFNHSSFASLRRQLNYFSFVRLGKGRQRESTYVNDGVIELDDILALRRRSAGTGGPTPHQHHHQITAPKPTNQPPKTYVDSIVPVVHLPAHPTRVAKSTAAKRAKKVKETKKKIIPPSPPTAFVSEDESSSSSSSSSSSTHGTSSTATSVSLDLTRTPTDQEILEGCTALLGLSGKYWG